MLLSALSLRSFARASATIAFALAATSLITIPVHASAILAVSAVGAVPSYLSFDLYASSTTREAVVNSNPQDIWVVATDSNPNAPEQLVVTTYFACPVYDDIYGNGGIITGFGFDNCENEFGEQQVDVPVTWGQPVELRFPLIAYAELATVYGNLVISAGAGTSFPNPIGDGSVTIVASPVPEPGTLGLAIIGVAILAALKWRGTLASLVRLGILEY